MVSDISFNGACWGRASGRRMTLSPRTAHNKFQVNRWRVQSTVVANVNSRPHTAKHRNSVGKSPCRTDSNSVKCAWMHKFIVLLTDRIFCNPSTCLKPIVNTYVLLHLQSLCSVELRRRLQLRFHFDSYDCDSSTSSWLAHGAVRMCSNSTTVERPSNRSRIVL